MAVAILASVTTPSGHLCRERSQRVDRRLDDATHERVVQALDALAEGGQASAASRDRIAHSTIANLKELRPHLKDRAQEEGDSDGGYVRWMTFGPNTLSVRARRSGRGRQAELLAAVLGHRLPRCASAWPDPTGGRRPQMASPRDASPDRTGQVSGQDWSPVSQRRLVAPPSGVYFDDGDIAAIADGVWT